MKKLLIFTFLSFSFLFSGNVLFTPVDAQATIPCGIARPGVTCLNPDGTTRPGSDGSDPSTGNQGDPSTGNDDEPSTGNETVKKKICTEIAAQPGGIEAEERSSIVPCGRTVHQCEGATPGNEQCEFKHLFALVNNLIRSFIFIVFAPLLTIVLMYIGFLFIKDQAGAKVKAKALLWRVLIGTFFVLASWLIVSLILQALGAGGLQEYLETTNQL